MCGKAEESVNHVLSECSKLAQKEYKRRHGWFGTKIHWEICEKYGIEVKEKWYENKPEVVMENDKCKILWDFTVQTDHEIYGRRPDVIVIQKDKNICQIVDFVCPYDGRVDSKELEKIEHYQDLARELRKIWNMKVKVIPLVIGALVTTPIKLRNWLKEIGLETQITEMQKTLRELVATGPREHKSTVKTVGYIIR